jgi:hypothetical protein
MKTHALSWIRIMLVLGLWQFVSNERPAWADGGPPPRIPLQPAKFSLQPIQAHGLRITACDSLYGSGGEIPAYGLCTAKNTGYSWVHRTRAVTYSIDLGHAVGSGATLLLQPGLAPMQEPTQASTHLRLDLEPTANGRGQARLVLVLANQMTELVALAVPTLPGPWNLVLEGTRATVQAPNRAEKSCEIDAGVLTAFADPLFVYCFAPVDRLDLPAEPPEITISRIRISGVPEPIDEQFAAPTVDTNLWQVPFSTTAPIRWRYPAYRFMAIVPKTARFWLSWPRDYAGPRVLTSSNLAADSWTGLECETNVFDSGYTSSIHIPRPAGGRSYFRLIWDWAREY